MDRDKETEQDLELDQLMEGASASVQKSLDATVDVKQRLRDLLREAGVEPGLAQAQRSHE
jgi:hypothetical protein